MHSAHLVFREPAEAAIQFNGGQQLVEEVQLRHRGRLENSMWDVVSQVGSGFTLIAFLVAAGVAILGRYLKARERQLLATPENERATAVQALNDAFLVPSLSVDPNTLSQVRRYNLLLEQIRDRSRRFYVTAAVIVIIATITAVVTMFAISRAQLSPIHVPNSTAPNSVPSGVERSASPVPSAASDYVLSQLGQRGARRSFAHTEDLGRT